jgi:hypothetical protein
MFFCIGGIVCVRVRNFTRSDSIFWVLPQISKFDSLFFSSSSYVSKKVCHIPVGQKLREEIDFEELVCFWTRAGPWMLAQKLLLGSWTGPEKLIKIIHQNIYFIKSYKTDTFPLHPYTDGQNFLCPI